MQIENTISYLLSHNNCVVIPELGGFVAKSVPSSMCVSSRKLSPPYKELTFNSSLTNNDGLLVSFYAKQHQLSYDDALKEVVRFSSQSKLALKNGKKVIFPKVGSLYANQEGGVSFVQDREFNLLLNAYGLSEVYFVPTEKNKDFVDNKTTSYKKTSNSSRKGSILVKYVAAAALIPFLFYSFWIPMTTDVLQSKVVYSSDFNPFVIKESAVYSKTTFSEEITVVEDNVGKLNELIEGLPKDVEVISYPLNEDTFVPLRVKEKKKKELNYSEYNFHIIGGCFSDIKNAEKLIDTMKKYGFDAFIIDINKGLHRVSVAQAISKKEAIEQKKRLKNLGFSSWVLKK